MFLLKLGVWKRRFKEGVSGGTSLVFPGTFLVASRTEKEHPKELRHETPFPKRLFQTFLVFGEGVWRKEFAQGTRPMFPGTSFFTSRTQKGHPKELRHETPYPERLFRTPDQGCFLAFDVRQGEARFVLPRFFVGFVMFAIQDLGSRKGT